MIALLAGFSVFGLCQSLTLMRKNSYLLEQVGRIQIELSATQLGLNQTRTLLNETYQKNAQLENEAVLLNSRLARAQKELAEQKDKINALGNVIQQARRVNEFLVARNQEISQQYVRVSFENQEMKKTLTSIPDLKKTIAALRKKPVRQAPAKNKQARKKPASVKAARPQKTVKAKSPAAVPQAVPADQTLDGNEGFVVKDGESTLLDRVDIRVTPAPAKGDSE
jgi:chromosome segregation ATPase